MLRVEEVRWLGDKTYQQALVPQPMKLGGLGVRSLEETSPAAFIGGVEMSLPHFTGVGGICPTLEEVVGIVQGGSRWETFLQIGCRTANEFREAWSDIKLEARQYAAYLGKELIAPLASKVESAGDSSEDGSTRKKTVQQREA